MIYWTIIWAVILFINLPMETILQFGVSSDNLWLGSMTYMYMHASWLHLIINIISMIILWIPVYKLYTLKYNEFTYTLNAATYLAAIPAGLTCATSVPTVGMSGMVFFLLGVLLMLNPTKRQAINYLWIVATIIIQAYFGHSNVALHIFAFIEGVLYISAREFLYQYKNGTGLFQCSQ